MSHEQNVPLPDQTTDDAPEAAEGDERIALSTQTPNEIATDTAGDELLRNVNGGTGWTPFSGLPLEGFIGGPLDPTLNTKPAQTALDFIEKVTGPT